MTMDRHDEESAPLSQADEIRALLPWYVTGRISQQERASVEAYLAAHPAMRAELGLARDEADAIFHSDAELKVPYAALDKLKASVASSPSVRISAARASFIDRVGEFLASLAPRQLVYAGVTAAMAFAILGGAVGSMLAPSSGYQTASGPQTAAGEGTFALLTFQPGATSAALTAFLKDNGVTVVDGPRANGLYRVRLSTEALSEGARDTLIAKLKAKTEIVATIAPAS